MKIGHKLLFGCVGLAMLIAALGYVSLRASQMALKEAIGESSAALAAQTLDKIQRNIYYRVENIQAHVTNPLMREFTARSNAQFEGMPDPNGYIKQVDADWMGGVDLPIISELAINKLAERLKSLQEFYNHKCGYPLFTEIFVTNKFGANVAQTNRTTDYYQADEEWWQKTRQDGLFISDVEYDESSGVFSTEIAVRIDDENGDFLGIAKAVLNIHETINIINEAKAATQYKTMQLYLVDKNGEAIYSTNHYGFLNGNRHVFSFDRPDQQEHKYYFVGQEAGEKGILFAHAHSKGYRGFKTDWVLLTGTESAEIFAPIVVLRRTMLLAGLVIMCLALAASAVMYRSIVVPVGEFQEATLQIAAGNLDTNITTTAGGEMGFLARSFQKMALQLKKTIADLNDEIVEHKKSEQALSKSEQRFREVAENSRECVWETDINGLYTYVSPVVREIVGYDSSEIVGRMSYYDLLHPEDREKVKTAFSDLASKKQPFQRLISRNVHKDGHVIWLSTSAVPIFDERGNVAGYRGVDADITEQRKAEAILSERTEQVMHHHNTLLQLANMPEQDTDSLLRTITEQSAEVLDVEQVSVWHFNADRTEIVCRDLFNRSSKTHKNGELLKVSDYPRYFKAMENSRIIAVNNAIIDTRTSEFADVYLRPKNITSMVDVPIRLHGRIAGIICHEHIGTPREWTSNEQDFAASVADMISLKLEAAEREKAEKALEKLNKDLEATIQELSRSNRQLKDFVHVAAHDLKTPVRGIGTLADWIVGDYGDKLDEGGRENIRLLKARVVRIDKLIDGMLQFSKIARSRQNEQETDLNSLVSEVIERIKPGNGIEIAVDSLPKVTCEREHIAQVFENLLSNAVAFMDKPKGLIKVGCVEQGDFWRFYVCDNGPGIERKHWERIFKIFQTLPAKDEPDTAGIGLTITRKIVEIYGGKIWVESQPGQGSTFFFTFPGQRKETIYANTKANTAC